MHYYTRTCVLCTEKIPSHRKLCSACYIEHKQSMHEQWFIQLAQQQAIQDAIDRRERYSIPYSSTTDIYGSHEKPELLAKRNIGRPSTDWRIIQAILDIYDRSKEETRLRITPRTLSLRAIANKLNNKVSYLTVRTILKEYDRC